MSTRRTSGSSPHALSAEVISAMPQLDDPQHLIPLLQYLPGFGCRRYWQLLAHVDIEKLLTLPLDYLLELLPPKARPSFRQLYQRREASELWRRYLVDHQQVLEQEVEVLTHLDVRYPEMLAQIHDAPPVLYVKGSVAALLQPQIAFVGSRSPTPVGGDIAMELAQQLVAQGLAVCSGLALGIDGQAHRGALNADGVTIAVMGTGIDQVYPARHRPLAQAIVEKGGSLISEFLPGTKPMAGNFPRRNRIISGLSLGVLVVEAALKSGSLITARYGLEHNRDVFAVPGSIRNPQAQGCHQLLKEGATLVESADDVVQGLNGWHTQPLDSAVDQTESEPQGTAPNLTASEQKVWQCLSFEPVDLDRLQATSELATHELLAVLMSLELKGMVAQLGGGYQRLC